MTTIRISDLPGRVIKAVAKKVLYSTTIMHAARRCTRRGVRILGYHRFSADHSGLIAQCQHIRRNYRPVSMRQLAETFLAGGRLPNGALAITVDDGYHDFLLNAQPVFSMYGLPVTVFLVTDFVDGRQWAWWDRVRYMFAQTRRVSVQFAGDELNLENNRDLTTRQVTEALKRMQHLELLSHLDVLQKRLEVELPEQAPEAYKSLSWEDVRKLAATGVEFGVHTKTHPILSKLTDVAQLHEEIAGSKERIEEVLQVPSLHFCYPNGTRDDYNEQTLAVVKQSGFATAVTAECGFNYAGADPFQLLRVGVEPSMPVEFFGQLLAGVRSHRKRDQRGSSRVTDFLQTPFKTTKVQRGQT